MTLHVDHRIPVALGGSNDFSNLQTLCDECNLGKGKYVPEIDLLLTELRAQREEEKRRQQEEERATKQREAAIRRAETRRHRRELEAKARAEEVEKEREAFRTRIQTPATLGSLEVIEFLSGLIAEFHWLSCADGVRVLSEYVRSERLLTQGEIDFIAEPFSRHQSWFGSLQSAFAKQAIYVLRANEATYVLKRLARLKQQADSEGSRVELLSWQERVQETARSLPDWGEVPQPRLGLTREERQQLAHVRDKHRQFLERISEFQEDLKNARLKKVEDAYQVVGWPDERHLELGAILQDAVTAYHHLGNAGDVIKMIRSRPRRTSRKVYFNRLEDGLLKPGYFRKPKFYSTHRD